LSAGYLDPACYSAQLIFNMAALDVWGGGGGGGMSFLPTL
jgi:hypothetical protein